jgi:hypothetical protein
VLCRADASGSSSAVTLNLLDHMTEKGMEKSLESYLILLKHWFDRMLYVAMLATIEDMQKAGFRPPVSMMSAAYHQLGQVRHTCQFIDVACCMTCQ